MIEGSGPIPLNNESGSGSRRPKNMWIRWIRIRIRIRIHRIHKFLGLMDLDPLVRGIDPAPDPAPDPSIFKQK